MRSRIKILWLKCRALLLFILKQILSGRNRNDAIQPIGIRKILFIRNDRIGDIVLSTPALKAIKAALPDASLTVVASRVNQPVLFNNPYVDKVIINDFSAPLLQQLVLARRLRRCHFDLVIDPLTGYDLKTAVFAYFTKAAIRIGYPGYGREVFFNLVAPAIDNRRHFIDLVLELPALIGVTIEDRSPQIFLNNDELNWAYQWIERVKSNGRKLVGIHPGGNYETQRWPVEYYADLSLALDSKGVCSIVILGGPADSELVETIIELTACDLPVLLDSDLRKIAAVMSLLDVLVCNNSGPLHMATAVNVATVSFMGPTIMNRWSPRGKDHIVLRKDELDCIGCNYGRCPRKNLDCMRLISPDIALEAVIKLL